MVHTTTITQRVALILGMAFGFMSATSAQTLDEVVGPWNMTINAVGREMKMTLNVSKEGDGVAIMIQSPQGDQPGENAKYENGELSWTTKMGPQALDLKVKVDGATFAGKAQTPFGEITITGAKLTAEELAAKASVFDAILGDWSVQTTYNGNIVESEMRISVEEGQVRATVQAPGSSIELGRLELAGDKLSWIAGIPYVSDQPAFVEVTVGEGKFQGTVRSSLGEIPITGSLVDTAKLVQAAYDDPAPILGVWAVKADINGEASTSTIEFFLNDQNRVAAKVTIESGEIQAQSVNWKKVSDTMGVVQVTLVIPDLGADPLEFEFIVDGNSFEGEELHSNGTMVVTGTKNS